MARGDRDEEAQAQAQMSPDEVNALVAEVVRHMLFRNFQQPGVPVRREELNQIVTRSYKQQRGLSGVVIDRARKKIASVFGMEMHELHKLPRQHSARGGGAGSQGASSEPSREYFVKSTVPLEARREFVDAPSAVALRGLALAIVSIIHLSPGRSCKQEDLWLHLGKLGIEEDDERHPVFGSIKHTMELLQRQRHFHKERSEDGFVYTLAERSLEANVAKKISTWIPKFMEWDMFAHDSDSDDSDDTAAAPADTAAAATATAAASQGAAANGDGDGDEGDEEEEEEHGHGDEERESLESE
ncbi:uncharacterized protein LOC112341185 [Selaginella moellendorffii]|uniref:uncharacterized protein LOC112341185 n=1 Tax=Selaginella moellendorffii TaxID=88036 RepID=UPI000D1D0529|nr:uncharacterized protein LOC112341185 [Selaginella moellendorffii]|eukprot:XP_024516673.1 uncharacterized protein LOC112341185 [Selaginella moellendorffii]